MWLGSLRCVLASVPRWWIRVNITEDSVVDSYNISIVHNNGTVNPSISFCGCDFYNNMYELSNMPFSTANG